MAERQVEYHFGITDAHASLGAFATLSQEIFPGQRERLFKSVATLMNRIDDYPSRVEFGGDLYSLPEDLRNRLPEEKRATYDKQRTEINVSTLQRRRGYFGALVRHHPDWVHKIIEIGPDRNIHINSTELKQLGNNPNVEKIKLLKGMHVSEKTSKSLRPYEPEATIVSDVDRASEQVTVSEQRRLFDPSTINQGVLNEVEQQLKIVFPPSPATVEPGAKSERWNLFPLRVPIDPEKLKNVGIQIRDAVARGPAPIVEHPVPAGIVDEIDTTTRGINRGQVVPLETANVPFLKRITRPIQAVASYFRRALGISRNEPPQIVGQISPAGTD